MKVMDLVAPRAGESSLDGIKELVEKPEEQVHSSKIDRVEVGKQRCMKTPNAWSR
jgi:hypothetical protein